jgi:23S rRNA (guanosine2251-2'-O)-methyltransferase
MKKLKNEELNRIGVKDFKSTAKTPVIIVLDNVRSALNVGSVFRSADAFLIEKIYLCGITATPPHKDILKSALGATETVEWKYFVKTTDALADLKKNGCRIFAVEQAVESISLIDFDPVPAGKEKSKLAIVLGHEVNGVDQEALKLCDGCIEVPQYGTKHSLNIAVCAGIVIWDLFVKIKNAG